MSDSRTRQQGLTRRSLAKAISGAAAAAILPAPATAAEEPVLPSRQNSEARTEALVDAALSATPAGLTAEQRLDVRRGVRDLQKTLGDARRTSLGYDIDPATVFLAEGRR
jgi:hypothetical protein